MVQSNNGFWKKMILVLTPIFIVGVINAVILYNNQKHIERDVINCKETKVNNDVLLQYIQLHAELHQAIQDDVKENSNKIKELERKLDDFINRFLSLQTRSYQNNKLIFRDDLYIYYANMGVNPEHYFK